MAAGGLKLQAVEFFFFLVLADKMKQLWRERVNRKYGDIKLQSDLVRTKAAHKRARSVRPSPQDGDVNTCSKAPHDEEITVKLKA